MNTTTTWLIFGAITAFLILAAIAGAELDAIAKQARDRRGKPTRENPRWTPPPATSEDLIEQKKGVPRSYAIGPRVPLAAKNGKKDIPGGRQR